MNEWLLVSDVHANYTALEAVLEKEDYDKLFCLGDIVGLNGFPSETVECVRNNCDYVIAGNHDVAVVDYKEGHVNDSELAEYERVYTNKQLTQEQKDWVNSLPSYRELKDIGVLLTHAKPNYMESDGYAMGNKGIANGKEMKYANKVDKWVDFLFFGHTHLQQQLDTRKFDGNNLLMINPGSLGYNGEYAIVDNKRKDIELKTVDYDYERTREKVKSVAPKTWW